MEYWSLVTLLSIIFALLAGLFKIKKAGISVLRFEHKIEMTCRHRKTRCKC